MFKRVLFGGGAVGALTAAYLVGSLTLGGAFAQTTPTATTTTPATTTTTPPTTGAAQPEAPGVPEAAEPAGAANETSETAALASQAKITSDQAKAAALAKFPGATVGKIELDSENGVVAYSVKLTDSAGAAQDVSIDATNGTVLATQAEGAEKSGAPEAPEAAGAAN